MIREKRKSELLKDIFHLGITREEAFEYMYNEWKKDMYHSYEAVDELKKLVEKYWYNHVQEAITFFKNKE